LLSSRTSEGDRIEGEEEGEVREEGKEEEEGESRREREDSMFSTAAA